jgi:hypothetical protein
MFRNQNADAKCGITVGNESWECDINLKFLCTSVTNFIYENYKGRLIVKSHPFRNIESSCLLSKDGKIQI